MTVRSLRILLNLAMAVHAAAALIAAAGAVASIVTGDPLGSTLPVVTDRPAERAVLLDGEAGASVALSRGSLVVRAGGLPMALSLLTVGVGLVASLFTLWLIRALLLEIGAGRPFAPQNVARLRRIGVVQLALFIWLPLSAGLQQLLLLPRLALADAALLPSIAAGHAGVENIRADLHIPFGLLAAGLIALVLAQAFRLGAGYVEDSEAMV
jgi:hypothetical protein